MCNRLTTVYSPLLHDIILVLFQYVYVICIQTLPTPARCDIPFPDRGTLMPIGKVSHLAEKLIVIEALPGTPPFDEGTVIWSKEKKSMARVWL